MNHHTGCLAIGLAILLCSRSYSQDQEPQNPKLSKFIVDALASPHAIKARLHVTRDGTIERATVYLKRDGLPDWTHDLADEKLGKGEDISYEMEVYGDGTEVYEICRQVDCYPQKISMRRDRNVNYLETCVDASALPEAVSTTLSKIVGFKADECSRRDGDGTSEYHITGAMLGIPHRVRITADGTLRVLEKQLAAEMVIGASTGTDPAVK
jgi:hypothetical protein